MTDGKIFYYRPAQKAYARTASNLGTPISSAAHCAALNSLVVAIKSQLLVLPFDQQQKARRVQTDFQNVERIFVWKNFLFVVENLNLYKIPLTYLTAPRTSARIQKIAL